MVQCATLSAKEAAVYLGISYWLLLEMIKRGELSPIQCGRRYLFREPSLAEWMTEQERSTRPQRGQASLLVIKSVKD